MIFPRIRVQFDTKILESPGLIKLLAPYLGIMPTGKTDIYCSCYEQQWTVSGEYVEKGKREREGGRGVE